MVLVENYSPTSILLLQYSLLLLLFVEHNSGRINRCVERLEITAQTIQTFRGQLLPVDLSTIFSDR